MKNKINFSKIETFNKKRLSYSEKNMEGYVKSGENNKFPQELISLYNNSSIHSAAINSIIQQTIAGGLTANEEEFLELANKKRETWNDIFSKVTFDYVIHGSFALEVIWSLDRSRIAEVYHIDFSHVRAKKCDRRGHIKGYYICDDWKRSTKVEDDNVDYLCAYSESDKHDNPNQLYVARSYRPGQQYYPLPDYNGSLKIIELDTEIDNFHVSNIQNGLAPSLAITTFMNGDDDEVKMVEELLRNNYAGGSNAGSLMYLDVDSPDNAPKIEPIPQNGADGYYTTINDLTVQKILTGHRITSPMLLGIKTEGQLGGRSEMIDAQILFQHNVIEPKQQDILKFLEELLQVNYPGIVLGVNTTTLFEDGEVEEDVVTSVETTDSEDININMENIVSKEENNTSR